MVVIASPDLVRGFSTRNPVVAWHWIPDRVRDDNFAVRDDNFAVRDDNFAVRDDNFAVRNESDGLRRDAVWFVRVMSYESINRIKL
jgi:hypothetical protein